MISELLKSQWEQVSHLNAKHVVVMTHFVPLIKGIPLSSPDDYDRYIDNNNRADKWWFEAASDLIRKKMACPWVFFGHTHKHVDEESAQAKMFCNPILFKELCFTTKPGIEYIAQLLRRGIKRID
jgi:hypothetical protein